MSISVETIKKLRDQTGAGMMDAKKALTESDGDFEKAVDALRKRGAASAAKRAEREAKAGVVGSYIHSDRIGVIVEVNCETDFVARTQDFKTFARDIAMHIAAMSPDYADPESVPQEVVKKEREIYAAEVGDKPADIREKIIEGKLEKFYDAVCLSRQAYVKDPEKSVGELTTELAAKVGENVRIGRFARIELGVE
jgi:elongation factor Ts